MRVPVAVRYSEDPMPYENGLEREPGFLSLGIAVYRDQRNFFYFHRVQISRRTM